MFSCINLFASFSIVIVESSAVRAVMVFGGRVPIFASGCMLYLARMRTDVEGPRA